MKGISQQAWNGFVVAGLNVVDWPNRVAHRRRGVKPFYSVGKGSFVYYKINHSSLSTENLREEGPDCTCRQLEIFRASSGSWQVELHAPEEGVRSLASSRR